MSDQSTDYRPRCINLFSKAMLVYGEGFDADPEHQGSANCWCLCTSKGYGPDGEEVSLTECSNPQRSCFQEY
jgi:hypothetical protein